MSKPLIPAEAIYDAALTLIDEQGSEALSARNLAAHLKCSTRTLYQQVGKREELIDKLIEYHLSSLNLDFQPAGTWRDSALDWSRILRAAFLSHPDLYRLMRTQNRAPVANYVEQLLRTMIKSGVNEELAFRGCRVLVNVVVSLSLSEIRSPPRNPMHKRRSKREIQNEDLRIQGSSRALNYNQEPSEVFDNTIRWLLDGLENELAQG